MTHAQQSSRVERHKTAYRVQSLLASLMTAIAAAAILYVIFAFWLVPVRVAGDSMAPTLQNGQVVLVDRAAKFIRTPKRGDIAAFYDPATGGLLLRRITALEGESIDFTELVKWCYRKKFYQQTLTIVESRAPEVFVNKGIFYYSEGDDDHDRVVRILGDLFYDQDYSSGGALGEITAVEVFPGTKLAELSDGSLEMVPAEGCVDLVITVEGRGVITERQYLLNRIYNLGVNASRSFYTPYALFTGTVTAIL